MYANKNGSFVFVSCVDLSKWLRNSFNSATAVTIFSKGNLFVCVKCKFRVHFDRLLKNCFAPRSFHFVFLLFHFVCFFLSQRCRFFISSVVNQKSNRVDLSSPIHTFLIVFDVMLILFFCRFSFDSVFHFTPFWVVLE